MTNTSDESETGDSAWMGKLTRFGSQKDHDRRITKILVEESKELVRAVTEQPDPADTSSSEGSYSPSMTTTPQFDGPRPVDDGKTTHFRPQMSYDRRSSKKLVEESRALVKEVSKPHLHDTKPSEGSHSPPSVGESPERDGPELWQLVSDDIEKEKDKADTSKDKWIETVKGLRARLFYAEKCYQDEKLEVKHKEKYMLKLAKHMSELAQKLEEKDRQVEELLDVNEQLRAELKRLRDKLSEREKASEKQLQEVVVELGRTKEHVSEKDKQIAELRKLNMELEAQQKTLEAKLHRNVSDSMTHVDEKTQVKSRGIDFGEKTEEVVKSRAIDFDEVLKKTEQTPGVKKNVVKRAVIIVGALFLVTLVWLCQHGLRSSDADLTRTTPTHLGGNSLENAPPSKIGHPLSSQDATHLGGNSLENAPRSKIGHPLSSQDVSQKKVKYTASSIRKLELSSRDVKDQFWLELLRVIS